MRYTNFRKLLENYFELIDLSLLNLLFFYTYNSNLYNHLLKTFNNHICFNSYVSGFLKQLQNGKTGIWYP